MWKFPSTVFYTGYLLQVDQRCDRNADCLVSFLRSFCVCSSFFSTYFYEFIHFLVTSYIFYDFLRFPMIFYCTYHGEQVLVNLMRMVLPFQVKKNTPVWGKNGSNLSANPTSLHLNIHEYAYSISKKSMWSLANETIWSGKCYPSQPSIRMMSTTKQFRHHLSLCLKFHVRLLAKESFKKMKCQRFFRRTKLKISNQLQKATAFLGSPSSNKMV